MYRTAQRLLTGALLVLCVVLGGMKGAQGQDNVYWRSGSGTGDWEFGTDCDTENPNDHWWNASSIPERSLFRPDCGSIPEANTIIFDNNSKTLMQLNSPSNYTVNKIIFKSTATDSRTINSDALRSLYFYKNNDDARIENNASWTIHTFNVNVNIAGTDTWMHIDVKDGYLVFNSAVVNQSGNTLNLWGNNNMQIAFNGPLLSELGEPGVNVRGGVHVIYGGNIPETKTYAGPTTIYSGGTLQISSNQTLGDMVLNSGAKLIVDAGKTLTITGSWTGGGEIINKGTIVLKGSAVQSFPGATTVNPLNMNNLTINNASGVILDKNLMVDNLLTLTSGILTTNSFNILVNNSNPTSIIGGGSTSYINGFLRRAISSGANNFLFPIGTSTVYAPVQMDFTAGTIAGTLQGFTTDGVHPNIGSSNLNTNAAVNRAWFFTIINGLTTANYNATFNWVAADQDPAFNYTTAIAGKYTTAWAYPSIGMRAPTSLQITGVSGFGGFQVANACTPDTPTASATPNLICPGGNSTLTITSGNLNGAANWYWYSGSCGGTPVGTGPSITVSPAVTTTYYVRGEGGCAAAGGICATVTVTIDNIAPVAKCKNITVFLDATTGNVTINPIDVDNGSTDNCSIASRNVSPSTFTCDDVSPTAGFTDLIISEYVEGSSSNKYIELYNGTGTSINLSDYRLRLYANGNTDPTEDIQLSGTLSHGLTIVYKNSLATKYTGPATNNAATNFNGDDAIALYKISTSSFVDIFGVIGDDPGSAWMIGANSTEDKTLRRKPSVTEGITSNPTGSGPTAFTTLLSEWDVYNIDIVSGLGSHVVDNIGTPVTLAVTDAAGNSANCTAYVVVLDNTAPTAICQNIILPLDETGNATLTPDMINAGSNDNCDFNMTVAPSTFNCINLTTAIAPDLIISEYVEGSGYRKYIEIYNGTGNPVNLNNYKLRLYSNGVSIPNNDITLTGTLANNSTIVYKHNNATLYTGAATTNAAVNFNGDDAIALFKISTNSNVDIFGNIGNDPGTAWTGAGGYTTLNKTLRRKPTITAGVTVNPGGTGPGAFITLVTQWDMFDIDDVTGLGTHGMISGGNTPVTLTVTDVNGNISSCTATVTVQDITSPEITCPAAPAPICSAGSYTHNSNSWDAEATDACGPITLSYTLSNATTGTGTTLNGQTFNVGTTTVTWRAKDGSGNWSNPCSFNVTIKSNAVEVSGNTPLTSDCYPDLKTAFESINQGVHKGVITVKINASTTEDGTAVLNASNATNQPNLPYYTSVIVFPKETTGLSVTGALDAPLIRLNGADNVTIHGGIGGTASSRDLTLNNTNVTAGAVTIQLDNGATGNIIRYCNIKGSGTGTDRGTIYIGGAGTTGNTLNQITNNLITGNTDLRAANSVYSATTTLSNTGTISANAFADFFSRSQVSNGILLGANSSDWTISGNNFQAAAATYTAADYTVINATSTGTVSIGTNTIGPLSISGAVGLGFNFKGIQTSGSGNYTVNGNTIGTTTANSITIGNVAATAANAFTGISNSATGTVAITGNTIQNCTALGTGASTFTGIYNNGATPSLTISNNNIKDIAVPGYGGSYGILKTAAITASASIQSNTISNINSGNSQFTAGMWLDGFAGAAANPNVVSENTVSNFTTAAWGNLYGIYIGDIANYINIRNNNLNALSTTSSAAVTGLEIKVITTGSTINLFENTIHTLSSSFTAAGGPFVLNGINFMTAQASTANITVNAYRNKIYNISGSNAATIASGARITNCPTTLNFYNNIIGDIKAPAANSTTNSSVNGIYSIASYTIGVPSLMNFFYNTIYLNATSTGATFSSSGIYHTTSNNVNFFVLDLRNNIIVNNSTPKGTTGIAAAYRRSSINFNNYSANSNNNLFYAGTPSANNLILYNTNSYQTLAAFYTIVGPTRESNSITENPQFLSTTGSDANYLHINPAFQTNIESGAAVIASVTNDFDGQARFGSGGYSGTGAAPDIGADEFDLNANLLVINVSGAHALSNGNYPTLRTAFTAINNQVQTSLNDINVTVNGSTVEPPLGAVLNAGGWNSLKVFPSASNYSITGVANRPLVSLNGADKVTIDGSVGGTGSVKSLRFNNSSLTANASTIHITGVAQNNTLKNCIIEGSSQGASSGIIHIAEGIAGIEKTTILIENNDITSANGRPVNALFSSNSLSITTGKVKNNNFYNFFSTGITGIANYNGILLTTGSFDWEISGNSFYETSDNFSATINNATYSVIKADNTSGHTISSNYIGGRTPACGGAVWYKVGVNTTFYGLYLSVPATSGNVATTTNNNVIQNIDWSSTGTADWTGIYIKNNASGTPNITNIEQNTIGHATNANSIRFNSGGGKFRGIFCEGTPATRLVKNNTISNITHATSNAQGIVNGITTSNGTNTIESNTISYLSINNPSDDPTETASVTGIVQTSTVAGQVIRKNTIFNLSNTTTSTSTTLRTNVFGLYFSGGGTTANRNLIEKNFIHSLSSTSVSTNANATVTGIRIAGGFTNYINNIVSISANSAGPLVYGINASAGTYYLHHNTVSLTGNASAGTLRRDAALFMSGGTKDIRDNIFYNLRTGVGYHPAIRLDHATNNILNLDFNDYFTGISTMGQLIDVAPVNLATWRTSTGRDANSLNIDPIFNNDNDGIVEADDFKPLVKLPCPRLTLFDFGLNGRPDPATMGAWENNCNLSFTTQPVNVAACVNDTKSFMVVVSGAGDPVYQWQLSTDGGNTWIDVPPGPPYSGITSATLNISPVTIAMTGYRYRCIIKDNSNGCVVTSNGALLTVSALPTTSAIYHQ